MKKFVVVLAMSSLLAIAGIAYAQGPAMMGEDFETEHGMMEMMGKGAEMGPGMMGGHHMVRSVMSLGLDDKQKQAVNDIVRETMKANIKKRAELDIARIDLKDLLDRDSVDMNAVEMKLKQIASLKADIHLGRIKSHEEIKSKLTPAQRNRLKEMMGHGMLMGKKGMMRGKGCRMMGEMKGGIMPQGNMDNDRTPAENREEGPESEHSH